MDHEVDESQALSLMTERLVDRFPDISPVLIREAVHDAFAEFADARVRAFVPVLANRGAVDRIARIRAAAADAAPPGTVPEQRDATSRTALFSRPAPG